MRKEVALVAFGLLMTGMAGYAAAGTSRRIDTPGRALEELASELAARERSIERREATVNEREAELRAIEERLGKRVAELQALRSEIDDLRAQVDQERADRVATVAKSVESMKPAQGAALVEQLETDLAIEVVRRMNKSKVGKLLAAMKPEKAATIAEGLATTASKIAPPPAPTP